MMDECENRWMNEWMDGWGDGWKDGEMGKKRTGK